MVDFYGTGRAPPVPQHLPHALPCNSAHRHGHLPRVPHPLQSLPKCAFQLHLFDLASAHFHCVGALVSARVLINPCYDEDNASLPVDQRRTIGMKQEIIEFGHQTEIPCD